MTPSQSVLTSLEQFFNRIGQLPTFTYYVQSRHTHEMRGTIAPLIDVVA